MMKVQCAALLIILVTACRSQDHAEPVIRITTSPGVLGADRDISVTLDSSRLAAIKMRGRLTFELPGETVNGTVDSVDSLPTGTLVAGTLDGGGEFTIMQTPDEGYVGHIEMRGGHRFELNNARGEYLLRPLTHQRSAKQCGGNPTRNVAPLTASPISARMTGDTEIKIGVIWTAKARLGANGDKEEGSREAIVQYVNYCAAVATRAFLSATSHRADSVPVRISIHKIGEAKYDESTADRLDWKVLDQLTRPDDGVLDSIHKVRSDSKYDIIVLIVENLSSGGRAWTMNQREKENFSHKAFAVVDRESGKDNHNFTHEIGHVFGCDHNAPSDGLSPDAVGWHFELQNVRYHTVMAYRDTDTEQPYPRFSDPDLFALSAPGSPVVEGARLGRRGEADNARAIREAAPYVSQFR
jgi:hypothetical protein